MEQKQLQLWITSGPKTRVLTLLIVLTVAVFASVESAEGEADDAP